MKLTPTQFILCAITLIMATLSCYIIISGKVLTPPSPPASNLTPGTTFFINTCTGVAPNSENTVVLLANCMGKIRGFVDGHSVTINMVEPLTKSYNIQKVKMWCIPSDVTDFGLYSTVSAWVENNTERVDRLKAKLSEQNLSTAIIIAAINDKYKCSQSL